MISVKDESTVNQTFIQWLATVTERINQQMHYQFNGKPAPLVFHTPQNPSYPASVLPHLGLSGHFPEANIEIYLPRLADAQLHALVSHDSTIVLFHQVLCTVGWFIRPNRYPARGSVPWWPDMRGSTHNILRESSSVRGVSEGALSGANGWGGVGIGLFAEVALA
ncbi:hypothetical protein J6590_050973 [Homalodisca vitripennis]|nr:hypothetical protein J6590_050973 [Homalodisca vitripennis]